MKRTPWFPVSVKPLRVGWYETRVGGYQSRRYFDGDDWLWGKDGDECESFPYLRSSRWRGLTEPSK